MKTTSEPLAALAALAGLRFTSAAPQATNSSLSFDYVIVGAGPGGLTVASRLSEEPSVSVAVIEAGTWSTSVTGNQSQVPAYDYFYNLKAPNDTNPLDEWGFVTTPQAGANGQKIHYARGKSLGGSTNLNYMGYTQTTAGALQRWADTVGDDSYAYPSSSLYYRKSMNFTPPNEETRLANASTSQPPPGTAAKGGPLDVSYSSWPQTFSTWIGAAMESVGIPGSKPFIDGRLHGSSWLTSAINPTNGHRASAETAFLTPIKSRPNLAVFDLTLAERILFDKNKTAHGVQVSTGNRTYTLEAKREVIVSGGTFLSPQLLQVSGVGPAEVLRQHNLTVVADRPGVGRNMNDHVYFGIGYRVNVETATALQYGDAQLRAEAAFNAHGTGPLASPGGDFAAYEKIPEAMRAAFAPETRAELAELPDDWPEIQYFTLPNLVGDFWSTPAVPHDDGAMYATLLATLVAPSSLGNVSIASARMRDRPLINPNWMTTQRDIDLVVAGFKRLRDIFEAPSMANLTIGPEFYPGSAVRTDDEIHRQIQESFNTMFHVSSTCRMGKESDAYAVVDNHARVYGVKNLRVVDASAFPFLPPGLPQATVYMLGEKIADSIKNGN
ncbi:GMC oxidoreductase-like protein [Apiospora marii]|uniref:GMC oxidoreductase-like protein n=1 Tax=Apiospora marii TaxID=335849 RepID=UPI00312FBF60